MQGSVQTHLGAKTPGGCSQGRLIPSSGLKDTVHFSFFFGGGRKDLGDWIHAIAWNLEPLLYKAQFRLVWPTRRVLEK